MRITTFGTLHVSSFLSSGLAVVAAAAAVAPTVARADGDPPAVVGGEPVPGDAWPDAVAVLGNDGRCTGTLVAPDVVLTAGHCIGTRPRTVVVGATDLADPDDGERIEVAWSAAYPDWERSYDVGVVVLERPSTAPVRVVARACTARAALRRGRQVTIVGYGRTSNTGHATTTKNAAAIAITDPVCHTDASCEASIDPGGEFIAGGGGVDACFGDSGGPAYAALGDTGDEVLVGVVSRGLAGDTACGGGGVYVRADRVVRWIETMTGRALTQPACADSGDDPLDGGDGDDDDDDDAADEASGGCATGGFTGAGAATLVAAAVVLATRRRLTNARG